VEVWALAEKLPEMPEPARTSGRLRLKPGSKSREQSAAKERHPNRERRLEPEHRLEVAPADVLGRELASPLETNLPRQRHEAFDESVEGGEEFRVNSDTLRRDILIPEF
jgi:hypothetical protein